MGEKFLSQEEIDSLLKKNSEIEALEESKKQDLSQEEKNIIIDIGEISMAEISSKLSELLGRKIEIGSPKLDVEKFKGLTKSIETPIVSFLIKSEEGISGENIVLMKMKDASLISNLLMGGDGSNPEEELSDIEKSTLSKSINQIVESVSATISKKISKPVKINQPSMEVWESEEEISIEGVDEENIMIKLSFGLIVDDLIESEIIQLYRLEGAEEIAKTILYRSGSNSYQEKTQEKMEEKVEDKEVIVEEAAMSKENFTPKLEEILQNEDKSEMKFSDSGVSVHKPAFADLKEKSTQTSARNIDLIMDVPLVLSVVLGRTKKSIRDILALEPGSIVELNKLAEEPLEVYINGKHTARGEVVVVDEKFGIRITDILSAEDRVRKLV